MCVTAELSLGYSIIYVRESLLLWNPNVTAELKPYCYSMKETIPHRFIPSSFPTASNGTIGARVKNIEFQAKPSAQGSVSSESSPMGGSAASPAPPENPPAKLCSTFPDWTTDILGDLPLAQEWGISQPCRHARSGKGYRFHANGGGSERRPRSRWGR